VKRNHIVQSYHENLFWERPLDPLVTCKISKLLLSGKQSSNERVLSVVQLQFSKDLSKEFYSTVSDKIKFSLN